MIAVRGIAQSGLLSIRCNEYKSWCVKARVVIVNVRVWERSGSVIEMRV
jgi:hypothetical protein